METDVVLLSRVAFQHVAAEIRWREDGVLHLACLLIKNGFEIIFMLCCNLHLEQQWKKSEQSN